MHQEQHFKARLSYETRPLKEPLYLPVIISLIGNDPPILIDGYLLISQVSTSVKLCRILKKLIQLRVFAPKANAVIASGSKVFLPGRLITGGEAVLGESLLQNLCDR